MAYGIAADTLLPTPTGWTAAGDLQAGDALFGADGVPRLVTSSTESDELCFSLHFKSGGRVVAAGAQPWSVLVQNSRGAGQQLISTADIADVLATGRAIWTDLPHLRLPSVRLPIDPYVLGAWLGDGTSSARRITAGIDQASAIREVLARRWRGTIRMSQNSVRGKIRSIILVLSKPLPSRCGWGHERAVDSDRTLVNRYRCRECRRMVARGLDRGEATNLPLSTLLQRHRLLGNKHIPAPYFRSSERQRIALIRGLMDADGGVQSDPEGRSCQAAFTNSNPELVHGVYELLASLGVLSTVTWRNPTAGVVHFTPSRFNPFAMTIKAQVVERYLRRQPKTYRNGAPDRVRRNALMAVQESGSRRARQIAVEGSGSILVGSYLPMPPPSDAGG